MKVETSKVKKDRYIVLTSRRLLICKEQKNKKIQMQLQWPSDCILNRINSIRDDAHSEVIMTGVKKSEKFVIVFPSEDMRRKWISAFKNIKPDKYKSYKIRNMPVETFLESNKTILTQSRVDQIKSGKTTMKKKKKSRGRLSILQDTNEVLSPTKLKKSTSQLSISDQLVQVNDMLNKPENKVSLHDLASKNSNYSDYISKIDLGNGWEEVKLNNGLTYFEHLESKTKTFDHPLGTHTLKAGSIRERQSIQSIFYDPSHLSFSMDAGLSAIDENESEVGSMIGSIASRPTYQSEASVFDIGTGHDWVKVVQPDGTAYFFNKKTGESKWNLFDKQ